MALNVGFYYLANAGGRLLGTIAAGLLYQGAGLSGTLWGSVLLLILAWAISFRLPRGPEALPAGQAQASSAR